MKLISAGISSNYSLNASNFLFNCRRNRACQLPYFVPIRTIRDLYFFVDLPGKPDFVDYTVISACCQTGSEGDGEFNEDFNEDFNIGGVSTGYCEEPILFDKYVIGQTPRNTWYGVFQTTSDFETWKRFFFRFTFTINGEEHIFYSEMFEMDPCSPLTCLKGCYPNEPLGASAWDCNGVYYGLHSGEEQALGDTTVRYFHQACVRRGIILDTTAKLTLSLFNTKRTYKSVLQREKTLEFELVPGFYKDVLLGIFARGTVRVEDRDYTLQTEQNWKVIDFHSKLWQLDTLLFDECKNFFGCKPSDCAPPVRACVNNITRGPWVFSEGYYTQEFTGDLFGGDKVEWQLLDMNRTVLESGLIEAPPLVFSVFNRNPEEECFFLKWRIVCPFGNSDWKEEKFGNCDPVEPPLTMSVSMFSYGGATKPPTGDNQCKAQGGTELRFRFEEPTDEELVLKIAGLYWADNGSNAYTGIGKEIIPVNHPDRPLFAMATELAFNFVIPAGTTDISTGIIQVQRPGFPNVKEGIISFPLCNPTWGGNARHKLYFRVESPSGVALNFNVVYDTPGPYNTVVGGITGIVQII